MYSKPLWSVTQESCTCGTLERAADDPESPIEFDPRVNEYHIKFSTERGTTKTNVRHCYRCGGKAPESKRAELFARVPPAEKERLRVLVSDLHTVEAIVAKFGEPDEDLPTGAAQETNRPDGSKYYESFRCLRYHNLSDTANVEFSVRGDGRVAFGFISKYIGPPKAQL